MFDVLTRHGSIELHAAHDPATRLRALVAIDDTRLGPALGGTRVFAYASEDEAILDVTRLARAMTRKAALAGLPHGGGKSVIWLEPGRAVPRGDERTALFTAFGRFVEGLGGRYVACEDSGTSTEDIDVLRTVTRHALGGSVERGGSGDPSLFTALGVMRGIEACAQVVLGRAELAGLGVAIQGVGHVGAALAHLLAEAGCRLTISDVDPARAARTAAETGAHVVAAEDIFDVACDVFSPCALGGAISDRTLDRLRCRIVAGAANNQLVSPVAGQVLHARGVFYAPDYAINAGGLINVAEEYRGYDAEAARRKTLAIRDTIVEIAARSQKSGLPPGEVADRMVDEILARAPQPGSDRMAAILASPASSRPRDTAV